VSVNANVQLLLLITQITSNSVVGVAVFTPNQTSVNLAISVPVCVVLFAAVINLIEVAELPAEVQPPTLIVLVVSFASTVNNTTGSSALV